MNQLLLAVSMIIWEGLKGRCFSRYGPERAESDGYYPFKVCFPIASLEGPALLPTNSRVVTATTAITYLSFPCFPAIDLVGFLLPAKIGRLNVPDLPVLLRTLNFNALEAPLLPEGAC